MAQRPLWWLTLAEKIEVSPYLWQIVLEGDSLVRFPQGREGDYIKLLLPKEPQGSLNVDPNAPDLSPFFKRSYTVCEFDAEKRRLVLFITRHQQAPGPAATWASQVRPGDEVLITGPGPVDQVDPKSRRFLLVGDLPSLGAILANLRRLPQTAQGELIFEAPAPMTLLEQACPPKIQIHWLEPGAETESDTSALMERLRQIDLERSGLGVWAACEYSNMKRLRHFFEDELGLPRSGYYLSSYFKRGASDEQHKQTRREEGYKD